MPGVYSTARTCFTQTNKIPQAAKCVPILMRYMSTYIRDLDDYEHDYEHLSRSKLPMMHFQEVLPRLPVPDLRDTCMRYLRAQQPLLTTELYFQTELHVQNFLLGEGQRCQNALIAQDKENLHTSYISKPWFDNYLRNRSPLPINSNPFLVFVNHPDYRLNTQLIRASNLVIASLRFYKSLKLGILEPEIYHLYPKISDTEFFKTFVLNLPKPLRWYGAYLFKAFPLDMSQYGNLFCTSRIPMEHQDWIKHNDHGRKHILVMRKGNFYVFDVLNRDGLLATPGEILATLSKIVSDDEPAAEHPLGVLTTTDRSTWASARFHLEKSGNMDMLDLMDTSLFALALDQDAPGSDPVRLVRLFLHGDGNNRWFDKSFSLIVAKDGTAGVNFEHSWGDGVAVLRYFNDIHKDNMTHHFVDELTKPSKPLPIRKLEFKLDDKAKHMIADAKQKYEKTCSSLEINAMEYFKFGRQILKPFKISPDAFLQLAFQVAYNNMEGMHVATYESCSTAAYKHGRTETVRPCTNETTRFCTALGNERIVDSNNYLRHLMKECSKVHTKLIREAAMGQGFDRHLFALRLQAEALGLTPVLFEDKAYHNMNHIILSTSTLASDTLMLGGFGPVVSNGLGVGYSIWKNKLGALVTNYKGQANGAKFIQALEYSLDKLYKILSSK